ncbi:excinuclease ABC subunit UvrC [Moraxella nonliquefaciens]|uniref:UvrABC system protein C n=1 Tax=Moraxella nonliquefaciens TaxID=478 RepID=A0A1B8QRL5_MORNO|nr:excinuclease ABC subunit UvrC [Moraxella nonliquefaciens]OBX87006.1 excinuclease ABC subunit C [Moraxella nonliquefaciens]QPT44384.1 excinuclease ABC subunit UvrC [Moraxella nonliquefaciens]QQC29404.1 excinuclease ABC subunit UvrC [Moraxella nonliquefaciens]
MNHAHADRLIQLLKNIPNLPGVYKMLGKSGEILYIGKAKSLKNRVNSYFAKTVEHPKTVALVARICDIEIIITRGESEALLLEQNLIKQHRPPYNIILRDDKSYLYLFISKDKFPRLAVGRGKGNHTEGRYFGPYPSANTAKEAVLLLQKLFMLRNCTNAVFTSAKRPCLEHQIKRCTAPCVGLISQADYDDSVAQALDFLNGKTAELQTMLAQKMHESAKNMHFEQAVFYRDRLAMLSDITAHQAVYRMGDDSSADVFAMADKNGLTVVHILTVRGGKVLGGKNYFPDDVGVFDTLGERLERFLLSFYLDVSDDLPKEIIINETIDDKDTTAKLLNAEFGKKCVIKDRVQKHRREWQDLAILNAHNALSAKLSDFNELNERFVAMQQVLGAVSDRVINRIECFDISHTMGELAVGSCVVFDSRGARNRDYRQYAIHDVVGGDDYGAMRQVLTRRYSKHPLPDLLLIDGGRGQLNVAKEVLTELDKLDETLLVSVAKGEGRKAGLEVLHFLEHEPIDLPKDSKALHLIMHIRDEAHRFAITAHRKKRDKARGVSVLEVIPNLGAKRRRDLLAHFGGIQQLLGASESEIAHVKGIGKVLAGTIYKSLHG